MTIINFQLNRIFGNSKIRWHGYKANERMFYSSSPSHLNPLKNEPGSRSFIMPIPETMQRQIRKQNLLEGISKDLYSYMASVLPQCSQVFFENLFNLSIKHID